MGIALPEGYEKAEAWKAGTMLPVGWHTVRIDRAEEDSSRDHPVIELEFSSSLGSIRDWLHVVPGAAGKVKALLEATDTAPENGEIPVGKLAGKTLAIKVIEEPKYNDPTKTTRKVDGYEHRDSGRVPADTAGLPEQGNGSGSDDDIPF
jgi:hypothetical protein